jgi:hypothetical protein
MKRKLLAIKLSFLKLSLRLRLKVVLKVHRILLVLIITLWVDGWERFLVPCFLVYACLPFLMLFKHHNLFYSLLWDHLFASQFLNSLWLMLRLILLGLNLHWFIWLISIYCWKLLHLELMNCNWLMFLRMKIHDWYRTGFFILDSADMRHLFFLGRRSVTRT